MVSVKKDIVRVKWFYTRKDNFLKGRITFDPKNRRRTCILREYKTKLRKYDEGENIIFPQNEEEWICEVIGESENGSCFFVELVEKVVAPDDQEAHIAKKEEEIVIIFDYNEAIRRHGKPYQIEAKDENFVISWEDSTGHIFQGSLNPDILINQAYFPLISNLFADENLKSIIADLTFEGIGFVRKRILIGENVYQGLINPLRGVEYYQLLNNEQKQFVRSYLSMLLINKLEIFEIIKGKIRDFAGIFTGTAKGKNLHNYIVNLIKEELQHSPDLVGVLSPQDIGLTCLDDQQCENFEQKRRGILTDIKAHISSMFSLFMAGLNNIEVLYYDNPDPQLYEGFDFTISAISEEPGVLNELRLCAEAKEKLLKIIDAFLDSTDPKRLNLIYEHKAGEIGKILEGLSDPECKLVKGLEAELSKAKETFILAKTKCNDNAERAIKLFGEVEKIISRFPEMINHKVINFRSKKNSPI